MNNNRKKKLGWKIKLFILMGCSFIIGFSILIIGECTNGPMWLAWTGVVVAMWYIPVLLIMGVCIGGADGNLG